MSKLTEKKCKRCKRSKDISKYTKKGQDVYGGQLYHANCKKCKADIEKEAVSNGQRTRDEREDRLHHPCLTPLHLKMQGMKWISDTWRCEA